MKNIFLIIALISFSTITPAFAQEHYKTVEGTYHNPSIEGEITIKDYKLSFEGRTYIFRTEESRIYADEVLYVTVIFDDGKREIKVINRVEPKQKVMEFIEDGSLVAKEYVLIEKN